MVQSRFMVSSLSLHFYVCNNVCNSYVATAIGFFSFSSVFTRVSKSVIVDDAVDYTESSLTYFFLKINYFNLSSIFT